MPERKKILVIDDEPAFVKVVEQVLTRNGYEVLNASSGEEGLRLLFAHRPDMVLLDAVMPGMDGWQTCSRIRDVSDVPIIILTGKQKTEEDIVHGLDCGADDYIIKPVGNKELLARVRAVMRRAELPSRVRKHHDKQYDAFIAHASEDKSFVRPLALSLQRRGLKVWYDDFMLKVGDSLRREIDKGLAQSQYGIVILSHNFFNKHWPQKELDGLAAREELDNKIILPVWHNIDKKEVASYSPTLADIVAAKSSEGVEVVTNKIIEAMAQ